MAENSKNINFKNNRKLQMFLMFLALSLFFWTLTKLSKEYTHNVVFKTNYTNLTNDKIIQNKPLEQITTVLKTSGFNLLKHNIGTSKIDVSLKQLQKKGDRFYYLTNNHVSELQQQLSSDRTIIRIYPDTLFFDFGKLKSKDVLVNPQLKINFKAGYSLIDSLKITPNKVTVSGPEKLVNAITEIKTKEIVLNEVSSSFDQKIKLDISDKFEKIHFSDTKITASAHVGKFTQGSIAIKYEVINVPENLKIATFSDKIKLTYKVSLDDFNKVQASDFKIVCDYQQTQKDSLTHLVPKMLEKSPLVSDIIMTPNRLDFLIKR